MLVKEMQALQPSYAVGTCDRVKTDYTGRLEVSVVLYHV